jgi:hypothetical protein
MALDSYDILPKEMRAYLRNYGYSFSKRACEYAISLMRKRNTATGKTEPIVAMSKEQAEELLTKHGIKLENNIGYNFVYVLNMAVADYFKSSLKEEKDLAQFVKDTIDDIDGNPDNIFRKWLVSMDGDGIPIDWEDMI